MKLPRNRRRESVGFGGSRMRNQNISDEFLNAFVDNQLGSEERDLALGAMARDDSLKTSACALRELKEMTRLAYHCPPIPRYSSTGARRTLFRLQSLAACLLLLMIGGGAGWLMSTLDNPEPDRDLHLFQAISHNDNGAAPRNIMVYVGNSNPVRLKSALDESENLLETYGRVNQKLKVEIIANDSGVDLLREGVSHYARRIARMQAKYPNLSLIACTQTLNKLQKMGVKVRLLPKIKSVSSAAEEIKKRLAKGWDYIRV